MPRVAAMRRATVYITLQIPVTAEDLDQLERMAYTIIDDFEQRYENKVVDSHVVLEQVS